MAPSAVAPDVERRRVLHVVIAFGVVTELDASRIARDVSPHVQVPRRQLREVDCGAISERLDVLARIRIHEHEPGDGGKKPPIFQKLERG